MTANAQTPKAASIPVIRKIVQLMRDEGAGVVRVMFDEQNRPYVEGRYIEEADDGMAGKIDAA